jgi:TPR repeat protein
MSHLTKAKDAPAARELDMKFALARCYLQGRAGLAKDESRAIKLLEQGAAQGHADSLCRLGSCFQFGHAVIQDAQRAAALW